MTEKETPSEMTYGSLYSLMSEMRESLSKRLDKIEFQNLQLKDELKTLRVQSKDASSKANVAQKKVESFVPLLTNKRKKEYIEKMSNPHAIELRIWIEKNLVKDFFPIATIKDNPPYIPELEWIRQQASEFFGVFILNKENISDHLFAKMLKDCGFKCRSYQNNMAYKAGKVDKPHYKIWDLKMKN
jgi:hypothetical protein